MARGGPTGGRGRGSMKTQQPKTQNGIGKKALGDIEILHTDTLIKEVIIQVLGVGMFTMIYNYLSITL